VILLLAAVLRLTWVLHCPHDRQAVAGDSKEYHDLAVSVLEGHPFSVPLPQQYFPQAFGRDAAVPAEVVRPAMYRAPLFPMALAAVYRVTGPDPFAGFLANVVFSVITCLVIYRLAREEFPGSAAWLGFGLFAFDPFMIYNCSSFLTETFFTLVLALALLCLLRYTRQPSWGRATATGLLAGLATLCRPCFIGVLPFWYAWRVFWLRRLALTRHDAAVVGAMVLTIAPWTCRNYRASGGHFVLLTTASPFVRYIGFSDLNLRMYQARTASEFGRAREDEYVQVSKVVAEHPDFTDYDWYVYWREKANLMVREDLWRDLKLLGYKGLHFLSPVPETSIYGPWQVWFAAVYWSAIYVLAVIGFLEARRQAAVFASVALCTILSMVLFHMLFFACIRYRVPFFTVINSVLAGVGLDVVRKRLCPNLRWPQPGGRQHEPGSGNGALSSPARLPRAVRRGTC
jgi:4-amino-4-deoxy-L-arabinose transferase-like glycosyltransferase